MLSSCSLSLTQRAATARRPFQSRRCTPVMRTSRRHVVRAAQPHDIDDPVLVVNRRGALAATALTSATLATGGSLLTPADTQAIISGYSPAGAGLPPHAMTRGTSLAQTHWQALRRSDFLAEGAQHWLIPSPLGVREGGTGCTLVVGVGGD
jgi:hypothetical protein